MARDCTTPPRKKFVGAQTIIIGVDEKLNRIRAAEKCSVKSVAHIRLKVMEDVSIGDYGCSQGIWNCRNGWE